jgi:hypothetical protein
MMLPMTRCLAYILFAIISNILTSNIMYYGLILCAVCLRVFACKEGRSALWYASIEGQTSAVKALLMNGADPNKPDNVRETNSKMKYVSL